MATAARAGASLELPPGEGDGESPGMRPVRVMSHMPDLRPLTASTPEFKPLHGTPARIVMEPNPLDLLDVPSTPLMSLVRRIFVREDGQRGFCASMFRAGSMRGAVFNLCSATLGAGALSLPYAFSQSGLLVGIALLVVGVAATVFSMDLLMAARKVTGRASYEDLTVYLFGKRWGLVVEVSIILLCFGVMVAYIVAVGDILSPLLRMGIFPGWVTRELLMVFFWTGVMLPLSLLDTMNSLRFSSLFGVVAIFYLVAAAAYHSIKTQREDGWHHPQLGRPSAGGILQAASIIVFSYTCQLNLPSIQTELDRPTKRRMTKVVHRAMGISFTVYMLMGIFGFSEFLSDTKGNILNNYDIVHSKDPVIAIAFFAITFTVVMAFPLNVFPCRYTIEYILRGTKHTTGDAQRERQAEAAEKEEEEDEEIARRSGGKAYHPSSRAPASDEEENHPRSRLLYGYASNDDNDDLSNSSNSSSNLSDEGGCRHTARHFFLTLAICGAALGVAILVPSINVVFQLLGSTTSAFVCFVMPAAYAVKLECWTGPCEKLAVWSLLIGGILLGIAATAVTIQGL